MKIQGTHDIQAPRDRVFAALIDPQVLQRCIPGCESLDQTADNTYIATMKAGVGAVKGTAPTFGSWMAKADPGL